MFKKKVVCVLIFLLIGIMLTGFGTSHAQSENKQVNITIGTAQSGGGWYPIGVAIANLLMKEVPEFKVSIGISGGGFANVLNTDKGENEIGMTMTITSYDGFNGNPPFEVKYQNIRNVLILSKQVGQYVVTKDSGIRTIDDLRGKRVNFYPKGWTAEIVAGMILKVYGLTYGDMKAQFMTTEEAINLIRDGHLDATLDFGGLGDGGLIELAMAREINLVNFEPEKIDQIVKLNTGLTPTTIPAGVYPGVDYEVNTFASQLHLIANANVPDDVIYKITKTIIENKDELGIVEPQLLEIEEKDMAVKVGIPNHPGAQRYFNERGW